MRKIKAIFLDLDGTLLRADSTVSEYTIQVLNQCKNKGIKIAVATGRTPETSEGLFENKTLLFDAFIYNCGAQVVANETLLQSHLLSSDDVKEVYARLKSKVTLPLAFQCSERKNVYEYKPHPVSRPCCGLYGDGL